VLFGDLEDYLPLPEGVLVELKSKRGREEKPGLQRQESVRVWKFCASPPPVMSIKLRKFVLGFYPSPVFVEHLVYARQDTLRTGLLGETVVHGPGAPAHLPESPFQDIGGADGFPVLWRKAIKAPVIIIKTIYILNPYTIYIVLYN
jgi:hypothetical protein